VAQFYEPDLGANPSNPFARDEIGKLVRRSYWLDLPDQAVVMAMTAGVGANLTNDQKRAHLADIKRIIWLTVLSLLKSCRPNRVDCSAAHANRSKPKRQPAGDC
jgi:hypothetical protein